MEITRFSNAILRSLAAAVVAGWLAHVAGAQQPAALANIAGDPSLAADEAERVERVTFHRDGQRHHVAGRVLVEGAEGGMLLQTNDGRLWTIEGDAVVDRRQTTTTFRPLTADELAEKLLAELPPGFRAHTTPHFVICYDTSRAYAEWTSSLFERLYKAFTNYWQRQGLELHEPDFPLAAIVYADRSAYLAAAQDELGGAAGNIVGYYSLKTNRVAMYDLTGAEALRSGRRRGSMRQITQMLAQPAALPLVATIVHEATHQITFNCGLQQRFADIPLWLCEGMAMYFEAPDVSSRRGWQGIGHVNYRRLKTFRRNRPQWRRGSLENLIADSDAFRDARQATAAYANAWALNYFLIEYRADQYAQYLKALAAKPPLRQDEPAQRIEQFRQHFGDLQQLEADFLERMDGLR